MNENKKLVWEQIKDRGLLMEYEEDFIKIVDENFDRFNFATDLVGSRDAVFVPLIESQGLEHSFHIALDVDTSVFDSYKIAQEKFLEKAETRELIGLNHLEEIIKNTNRNINLGIGFEISLNYDRDQIMENLRQERHDTVGELVKELRIFPWWYEEVAEDPKNIPFISKSVEKYINDFFKKQDKEILLNEIEKISNEKNDMTVLTKTLSA